MTDQKTTRRGVRFVRPVAPKDAALARRPAAPPTDDRATVVPPDACGVDPYRAARAAAQARANALGFDHGLERSPYSPGGWRSFMLPERQNRYGHELRCEVVYAEGPNVQRGHGYGAAAPVGAGQ